MGDLRGIWRSGFNPAFIKSMMEKYSLWQRPLRAICMKASHIKVKDFMSKEVISIKPNQDIYLAARMINKHDIDRLTILDNNRLVGILTRGDIIKALEKLG